ncbi:hypothetical protein ANOBCDAF_03336 [Pleomorphomonas sp. T1.2MG-36]|nr:hypothetical protein ANOBCDAF_03336 [Pleomorphomonas sp. T1.2MG-36]
MHYRIRDHWAEIAALLPITCPTAIVIALHLAGAL